MMDGAKEAESLCNLTQKVWRNSIYEKYDFETNKYTMSGFRYHKDFNVAIASLYRDKSTTVSDLKTNQSNVAELMKKLQKPPSKYKSCHDAAIDLYSSYQSLTDLAIDPSGTLSTFTSSKDSKVDRFKSDYRKMEAEMPKNK